MRFIMFYKKPLIVQKKQIVLFFRRLKWNINQNYFLDFISEILKELLFSSMNL